ncbi:reverse transcriptase domain, Reverse transcriptase zinc-binding domain protein (chloroplast) [Artemisia annua]|uniref:Reverse transcriptase domain, Reverse transcriptase zinc-binding domain protein n=1 Tax=Artemisia annua TaxID=35608 RepID=A0A2U1QFU2_ARTAN|nr:reverse transcriptase domain, Reverse transcriptase zinc-binding domain protein [Artemisia annua]
MASCENGGLKIGSLEAFNVSLMLKWRWRFVSNSHMLWVSVIKEIYGDDGGFDLQANRGSGTKPWARIIKLHSRLVDKGIDIGGRLTKRVALDHIPPRGNLLSRGINVSDVMCAIGGNEIEEKDHVFSSCEVAVSTWRAVFRWLHLSAVTMGTSKDIMQWVDSCGMPEKTKKVIEVVCLMTIWIL